MSAAICRCYYNLDDLQCAYARFKLLYGGRVEKRKERAPGMCRYWLIIDDTPRNSKAAADVDSDLRSGGTDWGDYFLTDYYALLERSDEISKEEEHELAEKHRRNDIIAKRTIANQCWLCGKRLGLFDRLASRFSHKTCTVFKE